MVVVSDNWVQPMLQGIPSCLSVVSVPGLGSKPCYISSFDKRWRLVPEGLTSEDGHLQGSSIFLYLRQANLVPAKRGAPEESVSIDFRWVATGSMI